MNKEEILAMSAGRELDALVGLKLGLVKPNIAEAFLKQAKELDEASQKYEMKSLLPKYSTDISAAWEVVESVKAKGYRVHLNIASKNSGGVINGIAEEGDWHCNVLGDGGDANHVYAKTAPEAISKAALLAVME